MTLKKLYQINHLAEKLVFSFFDWVVSLFTPETIDEPLSHRVTRFEQRFINARWAFIVGFIVAALWVLYLSAYLFYKP